MMLQVVMHSCWMEETYMNGIVVYQSGWLDMFLLNLVEFDFTLVRSAQWIMIETLSSWVSCCVMMRMVMLTNPICHILLNSNFLFLSFLHPLLFSWNICKLTIYLSVMQQKPNDWLRTVNVFLNIRLRSSSKNLQKLYWPQWIEEVVWAAFKSTSSCICWNWYSYIIRCQMHEQILDSDRLQCSSSASSAILFLLHANLWPRILSAKIRACGSPEEEKWFTAITFRQRSLQCHDQHHRIGNRIKNGLISILNGP